MVDYFKAKTNSKKNTKEVNKNMASAGSCYEGKRRQNIYQVFIRVKFVDYYQLDIILVPFWFLGMYHVTQR